jgi:predicted outer membrane repeat protein
MMVFLSRWIKRTFILLTLAAAVVSSVVTVTPVSAENQIVTNVDDSGLGSLRQAILDVSHNGTITFDSSLDGTPITLEAQLPPIEKAVTIIGNGASSTIIQASTCNPVEEETCTHYDRIFYIESNGDLTLEDMTVRHGRRSDAGGGVYNLGRLNVVNSIITANIAPSGGGIINIGEGVVDLDGASLSHNQAATAGGGIYTSSILRIKDSSFVMNDSKNGGGIWNYGSLEITNSDFTTNTATSGGGILNATLGTILVVGGTFSGNSASGGGGIVNNGNLEVTNSSFSENNVLNSGGGIVNGTNAAASISGSDFHKNSAGNGGGIANYGSLAVADCTLSENTALNLGGGIENGIGGTFDLIGSTLIANHADYRGGGMHNTGELLTVSQTSFTGNTAGEFGGGIFNEQNLVSITDSDISDNVAENRAGGVYNMGTITITGSTLSGNSSDTGGGIRNHGTMAIADSTISTNHAVYVGGGIYNYLSGTMTIEGCDISGNTSDNAVDDYGAGIANDGSLTVSESTIMANFAYTGGGIHNGAAAVMEITDSSISGNFAQTSGGGIKNFGAMEITDSTLSGNTAVEGGGIHNGNYGTLTIFRSTLAENIAESKGSGIYNAFTLNMTNSTLSGNKVLAGSGGGIYNTLFLNLTNCTLSGNDALYGNGGGVFNMSAGGNMNFYNTIIANSGGTDCYNAGYVGDNIHNLVVNNAAPPYQCGTPFLSTNPLLDLLTDNGGATLTHALVPESPAVDAGSADHCALTDQRGVERPQGAGCDIGAYELEQGSQIFLPLILR